MQAVKSARTSIGNERGSDSGWTETFRKEGKPTSYFPLKVEVFCKEESTQRLFVSLFLKKTASLLLVVSCRY